MTIPTYCCDGSNGDQTASLSRPDHQIPLAVLAKPKAPLYKRLWYARPMRSSGLRKGPLRHRHCQKEPKSY
jgi:hypothetical protein